MNIKPGTMYYDKTQHRLIYIPLKGKVRADVCRPDNQVESVKMFPRILNALIERLNKLHRHFKRI